MYKNTLSFFSKHIMRFIYVIIFVALIFFSPFKYAIFVWDFPMNFALNFFYENDSDITPPLLSMPLTENTKSFDGRQCKSDAQVSIYVNNKDKAKYMGLANKSGIFSIPVDTEKLKPGDRVWVKQCNNGNNSDFSPTYQVINTNHISWYLGKENSLIASIKHCTSILLSWSVLIIGGFVYFLIKEDKKLQLLFLFVPTVFLFLLSIYFGFSCIAAINSALSKAINVSSDPMIDYFWWKQIKAFQQAIFLSAIIIIWNIPRNDYSNLSSSRSQG